MSGVALQRCGRGDRGEHVWVGTDEVGLEQAHRRLRPVIGEAGVDAVWDGRVWWRGVV